MCLALWDITGKMDFCDTVKVLRFFVLAQNDTVIVTLSEAKGLPMQVL